jgi:hypothetical protein
MEEGPGGYWTSDLQCEIPLFLQGVCVERKPCRTGGAVVVCMSWFKS